MSILDFRKKIYEALKVDSGDCEKIVDNIQDAFIPRRTADFRLDRVEQVAMYVPNMDRAKAQYAKLGLINWVDDIVTGRATVYDGGDIYCGQNRAHLAFNYDLGFELELIRYLEGPNWHYVHDRVHRDGSASVPFPSHMSWHVESMEKSKARITEAGFRVAQEVKTIAHTNPYLIEKKRTFNYCVFDTRALLGWDIKLIERVEAK